MALALTSSQEVDSAASNTTSTVSSAITVSNGDILVVKTATEDAALIGSLVTGGAQTWTRFGPFGTSGTNCGVTICTCTVSGSPGTVTATQAYTGSARWHSSVFERWTGGILPASPLRLAIGTGTAPTGSGAPNGTTISATAGSQLSWVNGDFAAIAPGTPAYRSSAVQDGRHDKSTTFYVAYYATQAVGSTGTQTVGMTAPSTQNWNIAAIEIQDAGAAAAQPIIVMPPRRP